MGIFGRGKKADPTTDEDELNGAPDETDDQADDSSERFDDETPEDEDGVAPEQDDEEPAEDDGADEETAEPLDEWAELDASRDWRYDGPFDIDEVDLDADDVERLDFGTVILTPFDGMKLQLQVSQAGNQVQAVLVMHDKSALEVALFAAPSRTSMLAEVRADMAEATEKAEGTMTLACGPFGTEVRRVLPVTTPDGRTGEAITRTWFAEGPKWLLRGVLMGEAAGRDDETGPVALLYEFFCNLVVRRGEDPHVPGQLIPMTVPASLVPQQGGKS